MAGIPTTIDLVNCPHICTSAWLNWRCSGFSQLRSSALPLRAAFCSPRGLARTGDSRDLYAYQLPSTGRRLALFALLITLDWTPVWLNLACSSWNCFKLRASVSFRQPACSLASSATSLIWLTSQRSVRQVLFWRRMSRKNHLKRTSLHVFHALRTFSPAL
ncbi:hypothetical protein DFH06DRAFT_496996 [Mycena polygramma]|nr:hypothetical protein DFH06DRAFT_496996 [Mycena polygramma]